MKEVFVLFEKMKKNMHIVKNAIPHRYSFVFNLTTTMNNTKEKGAMY